MPPSGSSFTVCTINVRLGVVDDGVNCWERRKLLLAEQLRSLDADIICAQEGYRFQVDYLVAALQVYDSYFVGREDGVEDGESCAILYRRDRLIAEGQGTFWLSESPEIPASMGWDAACTRICSWVQFDNGLTVSNSHWDHISSRARLGAANLICERFEGRSKCVVCGDFNAEMDSEEVMRVARSFRTAISQPSTTFHAFGLEPSGPHIDHIFHSSDLWCTSARIDRGGNSDAWPSDHFPVVATFLN